MLEFSPSAPPIRRDIHSSDKLTLLLDDLQDLPEGHTRLFIVEDLSRDVIEALGSTYDIDPLFFRSHINDYLWYNTQDPWAELGELPSISQSRRFWNFRYMRPRYFQDQAQLELAIEQMGAFNVLRRLEQDLSYRVRKLRRNLTKEPPVGSLRTKSSLWIRENGKGEYGTVGKIYTFPNSHPAFILTRSRDIDRRSNTYCRLPTLARPTNPYTESENAFFTLAILSTPCAAASYKSFRGYHTLHLASSSIDL